MCLIKLVRIRICSQHRVFPFFIGHGKDSEGYREAFIQRTWKDSEGLVLRAVPDEEFLQKKINNKDVYEDHDATKDIQEDACSLRQYGDLTALKRRR